MDTTTNPHEKNTNEYHAHNVSYRLIQAYDDITGVGGVHMGVLLQMIDIYAGYCGCNDPETGEYNGEHF